MMDNIKDELNCTMNYTNAQMHRITNLTQKETTGPLRIRYELDYTKLLTRPYHE